MADEAYTDPRLAALYDLIEADRTDLHPYLALARRLDARHVLDLGCGTGTLALALTARGHTVTAADPAAASIAHARTRPGAHHVHWIHGDARALPPLAADLAVMTANTAQEITTDTAWHTTLTRLHTALRPGARLVFETRDPDHHAWHHWNRDATHTTTALPDGTHVTHWIDLLTAHPPLVTFRRTYTFHPHGPTLTSHSTLRFRTRTELTTDLLTHGYTHPAIHDAPDRPGRELVLHTTRP
ncbi:class I SAM-dependent methyltransferase [Streptomyces sp. CBMA156]|uniref:class I SAM-dependent methyltransferase n=1 Tax=Streptomyces sp. CBMA156 TaxID=1930280 RepID=UPI0016619E6B|nr:class I SAM-dependent methyltransferase [Streptomyces sp. CBMA156]MBD0670368.1 SAM-dependent methyltransferase [Streptomyces sp. CBMA156]